MFGRIVDFDAEFNGIVCGAEDLAGLLPSADPVMARYARQYLDAMISRPDMTLADKVRWLVRDMLPLGRCSVEKVAQHLGVDRRTVHRHLAQSGETFSSLVDQVRGELAESYLEGNKAPPRRCRGSARVLGAQRVLALAQAPLRLHADGKAQRQVASGDWPSDLFGELVLRGDRHGGHSHPSMTQWYPHLSTAALQQGSKTASWLSGV